MAEPDEMPNTPLKVAILELSDMFRMVLQKCLNGGLFPDKKNRNNHELTLLSKPGKNPKRAK